MTVADMIAQRKIALDCILNDSNNAISAKGGTPADNLSGLQDAIVSIPSGGSELPEMATPAEVGHVLAGKEYIDGNGDKKSGTLVVCDTVYEVETLTYPGTGLTVELESSADGSNKTMTIPEPNLLPENIKNGVSIFGIAGTAKTLRVETGTITPAEDTTTLSIPCSDNPKYAVLTTTAANDAEGDILGAIIYNIDYDGLFSGNCLISYYYRSKTRSTITVAAFDSGISLPELLSTICYRAGTAYQWTAYYWEDT